MSSASSSLADALREVLLDPAQASELTVHGRTQAAVLVPLYLDAAGELYAVFTRRHDGLRRHPGEISFPGGRRDDGETDLRVTALREAEEEIGLARADVQLLGALTPTPTIVSDYAIHPFVGLIEPGLRWRPSAREVDAVLELRICDLVAGFEQRRLVRRGIPFRTAVYEVDGHVIWGATARIVTDLLARLDARAPSTLNAA